MAPPFTPLIESLPADHREAFLREVLDRLADYHDGATVDIPIEVVVGSGVK